MPELEFRMLGPLEVVRDGVPVELRAAKQRALLAVLLWRRGQVVSLDELAGHLWGENPPGDARGTLRAYVMRLRNALGAAGPRVILTRPDGYLLDTAPGSVDLWAFDALLARADEAARREDLTAERALLHEALALWRGPALSNVPSDSLHRELVPALAERRLTALERRIDLDLRAGAGHACVVSELRHLTAEHPLRERFWAQLMLALAWGGRQAEALGTYARVRAVLRDELGADPGPELRELHTALLRGEPPAPPPVPEPAAEPAAGPAAADAAGARPEPPRRPLELPPDLPDFVGREVELADITKGLTEGEGPRILVVTGSPGVGKTALAVRAAHESSGHFPDGQLHADLRGYAAGGRLAPTRVLARFLRALGTPREQIPVEEDEQLALYRTLLAGRRMLVVLDNAADAEQIRPLLPGGRSCAVLITSRNALRGLALHGARTVALDPLGPADSVRLLASLLGEDRVHREPEAAAELARLCSHIPLALRIAAANLVARHQDIAGYAEELRHGDRLAELGVDDDPQAAVRGAFDLSYAALGDTERAVFRLLGLVPGRDVTPDAAAALTRLPVATARRALERLATASLVQSRSPGRYGFHDLMRDYACERAAAECAPAEREAALERLLSHYLGGADRAAALIEPLFRRMPRPPAEAGPRFADAERAAAWLSAERANLFAAIHWAAGRGSRGDALGRYSWFLVDALRGFLARRSLTTDWLRAAEAALGAARAAGDRTAEAEMLHSTGQAWWRAGAVDRAVAYLERSVEAFAAADWPEGQIAVLNNLAGSSYWQGRVERAVELFTKGLRLAERHGLTAVTATMHGNLGAAYEGLDLRQAERHLEASCRLIAQQEPTRQAAVVFGNLASVRRNTGDYDSALREAEKAIAGLSDGDEDPERWPVLNDIARIHHARGDLSRARATAAGVLERSQWAGDVRVEADARVILAGTLLAEDPARAREHLDRALASARDAGYRNGTAEALIGLSAHALSRGDPGEARRHASEALDVIGDAHRVLRAQALTALAEAERAGGDLEAAAGHAQQAVDLHHATGARPGEARAARVLGGIARDRGAPVAAEAQLRRAYELYTAMSLPEAAEVAQTLATDVTPD